MPFAEYKDFDGCVRANKDKDSPEAYCASIHKKATGDWPNEKAECADTKELQRKIRL